MAMSIVGRLNLGGFPIAGVMDREGRFTYRPTPGTLRQADFAAGTDIFLANINHVTGGAGAPFSACIVNNNYCGIEDRTYGAPGGAVYITMNDIDTGAYNVQQLPPGTTTLRSYGVTRPTAFGDVGSVTTDQAIARASHFCTPPLGVITKTQVQQAARLVNNVGVSLGGHPFIPAGASQFIGVKFDGVANSNFATGLTFDPAGGAGPFWGNLSAFFQTADSPWFVEWDGGTFLYYFRFDLNAPFNEIFVQHEIATNIKTSFNLGPYTAAPPTLVMDAFKVTPAFTRFHFASFAPTYRLYSADLNTPGLKSAMDSIDLDTGNPQIRGIWIYPPHIYVGKVTGGTFGNQLIKVYDSALDTGRRQRRSGSEIWSLIPEIKDYM